MYFNFVDLSVWVLGTYHKSFIHPPFHRRLRDFVHPPRPTDSGHTVFRSVRGPSATQLLASCTFPLPPASFGSLVTSFVTPPQTERSWSVAVPRDPLPPESPTSEDQGNLTTLTVPHLSFNSFCPYYLFVIIHLFLFLFPVSNLFISLHFGS